MSQVKSEILWILGTNARQQFGTWYLFWILFFEIWNFRPSVNINLGIRKKKKPADTITLVIASAGEGGAYRSRTDDLLTASQTL